MEHFILTRPLPKDVVTKMYLKDKMYYAKEYLTFSKGLPDLSLDNLVNLLTLHIFWVTGFHEFTANNVAYLTDPFAGHGKNRMLDENNEQLQTMSDIQTWIETNQINLLTSIKNPPLIADWTELFNFKNSCKLTVQAALATPNKHCSDAQSKHKSCKDTLVMWHHRCSCLILCSCTIDLGWQ